MARSAKAELDEWVAYYNQVRPHQAIGMRVPAERFRQRPVGAREGSVPLELGATLPAAADDRAGADWVCRRAAANGVVSVSWQQVCLGKAAAGHNLDVHVGDQVMQFWDGPELLRTVARNHTGEVRKKRASIPGNRRNLKKSVKDQPT